MTEPPPLAAESSAPPRTLCLGEALVDLICERPARDLAQADAFRPHFGGAVANVAVAAARAGATVSLAGGVGEDAWGRWLRERLEAEGVGLDWFAALPGLSTPVAFVTVDEGGEPAFEVMGAGIAAGVRSVAGREAEAMDAHGALFLTSNTLVGDDERATSALVRDAAADRRRPIVFDPNLRLGRWDSAAAAIDASRPFVAAATLVKANRTEASLLAGDVADPAAAAAALVDAGAAAAVVTLGPEGALVRGGDGATRHVEGVPARVVSAVGAGDAFSGTLIAGLARTGFDMSAAALVAAAQPAVRAGAAATERWGAV